jgi:hypothetical protein
MTGVAKRYPPSAMSDGPTPQRLEGNAETRSGDPDAGRSLESGSGPPRKRSQTLR